MIVGLAEESVHEPESVGGEDSIQLGQIIRFVGNAVETTDIERKVKLPADVFHLGGVVGKEAGLHACGFYFSFRHADGTRGEVEALHLPACFGECDDVGARAAADIERAPCRVALDEFEKFGRGDAAIPGWAA